MTDGRIDDDNSGFISVKELDVALKTVGLNLPGYQIRELVAKYDSGAKDGKLDMKEFEQLYIQEKHLKDDPDCKNLLPLGEDGVDLYKKVGDGILLCKLINHSVPDTIDERTINKTNLSVYRKHENLTLAVNSAGAIGCSVVNIGPEDLAEGKPHLVLGLLWQIIRIGLLSDINLAHHPGLVNLLQEGETIEDLIKLSPEQILLRWVNYHLARAGCDRQINNFGEDIKDSEAYTYLLHQIAPAGSGVDLTPLQVGDKTQRAEAMLVEADKIGCRSFVGPHDVVSGNQKLNLAFVANLFNTYPALDKPAVDVEYEPVEESREEKTYRNWMNSLGVTPYVHYLYNDLCDGLVIFQLYDHIEKGMVDWSRVKRKFDKMKVNFQKVENCNYAVELGPQVKVVKVKLVGIAGKDIFDGNSVLTLGLVWQLMRAYTLAILRKLTGSDKPIQDVQIIEWANSKLKGGDKISGFNDPALNDGVIIIKVIDAIKPGIVNWENVNMEAKDYDERLANARYAIGLARKIGAGVYALPEDIVEVKNKMLLTVFACLMTRDFSGRNLTQGLVGDENSH
nr:hypothetical protein BaRGS_022362 [Batillaria attramentaria]